MVQNRSLSRSISDMAFFEFRRQLDYKASQRGGEVVAAHRWYPSSKLCNVCGVKNTSLRLGETRWTCVCGASHDRDINAAVNLRNIAVSSMVSVCEEEGSGSGRKIRTKPASVKQKVSFEIV